MERNVNVAEVIRAITDEYGIKILLVCYETPRSAQELSDRWEIPIAACYRRIHMMESLGILMCASEIVGRRGRIVRLYKSALRELEFQFKDGKAQVRFMMDKDENGISDLNGKWVEIK
jgi:predicted transcriptional regulator